VNSNNNLNVGEAARGLLEAIRRYKNILIVVKGSPDPDVLASSFVLRNVCDHYGIRSRITALAELSLPQNRAIVKKLRIPVRFEKSLKADTEHDAYAVLDFQSAGMKELSEKIPCAVHIDHHEGLDRDVPADFRLLSDQVGSVSTVMALILRELALPFEEDDQRQMCTALFFGIHTDTDHYRHATPLDYEALEYLSPFLDMDIINSVLSIPMSDRMITLLGHAFRDREIYRGWLMTGIGFVDETDRDNIALIADYLLEREEPVETVIVYALIEKGHGRRLELDASIRTRDEKLDLNGLIRSIPVDGGARAFKGAFQVNLDFFSHCPDRQALWDLASTTIKETMKNRRDNIGLLELKGFYRRLKKTIGGLFGSDG